MGLQTGKRKAHTPAGVQMEKRARQVGKKDKKKTLKRDRGKKRRGKFFLKRDERKRKGNSA